MWRPLRLSQRAREDISSSRSPAKAAIALAQKGKQRRILKKEASEDSREEASAVLDEARITRLSGHILQSQHERSPGKRRAATPATEPASGGKKRGAKEAVEAEEDPSEEIEEC